MRILTAHDLGPRSAPALRRAATIAGEAGGELRIVHALPPAAPDAARTAARDRLEAEYRAVTGGEAGSEAAVSIRVCSGSAADLILGQARAFRAGLIVLGGHGEPRLKDALLGTTASHVVRESAQPLLVARNDSRRPYRKIMIAVDFEAADAVLEPALGFASPDEICIVHAFGSVLEALAGATDLLEDVRTDQDVLARLRQKAAASGRKPCRIQTIVEEGDAMDVIMRAWTRFGPDLLVMGTHGRAGVGRLLHGSLAETAILGCPSDMLIMRTTAGDRPGS